MKKLSALFFALALVLGLTNTGAATAAPVPQSSNISAAAPNISATMSPKNATAKTTSNLHQRKGAGTNHKSLQVLKKGTTVTKTGKSTGKWVQVKAAGKTGWVSSKYLTSSKSAPAKKNSSPSKDTTKTTANLHLRKGAGTNHKSLQVLKIGSTVTKTGKTKGKWVEIKAAGKTGWVSSGYLSNTKSGSTQTKTASKAKKTPTKKAPAKTSKPKTRAQLISYAKQTMAPYCPNVSIRITNSRVSTYRFLTYEITLSADLLNRPMHAIKFVVLHECAHNLQDRAAGGFGNANRAASKHFGRGLHGGSPLETQADIMAQILSGSNAKSTGFYTNSNPSTAKLQNARNTINQGRRIR